MMVKLKDYVRTVPDYPKPGIMFLDISPLLASPLAFREVTSAMASEWYDKVDGIAALDARGFIFGAALAQVLGKPLAMIRKRGKLPGEVETASYSLEYGTNEVEIQNDAFARGSRVLVVDDVLATGGTAAAARTLIEKIGSQVVGYAFVIEIKFLHGRKLLGKVPIQSLLRS